MLIEKAINIKNIIGDWKKKGIANKENIIRENSFEVDRE